MESDLGDIEEVELGETKEIKLDEKPEAENQDQRNVKVLYEGRINRKPTHPLPVAAPKKRKMDDSVVMEMGEGSGTGLVEQDSELGV